MRRLAIVLVLLLILSLVIGAVGCAGETVSTPKATPTPKTISQAEIRIVENSTEKLIIAFDYFTNDGQQAHFSDADLIAPFIIFPTDNPMIIVLSSVFPLNDPTFQAFQVRAYIEDPQIHNSEDTITIPKSILNFQDLDRSKMTLVVVIRGNFNTAMYADIHISVSGVDLAL